MWSIASRAGDRDSLTYDGVTWKLDSLMSPTFVRDSGIAGSATVRIKTKLQPWQTMSLPTTSTAVTMFPPFKPDSIRGSTSIVGGVRTDWLADRWGQPLTTTTMRKVGSVFQKIDSIYRRPYMVLVDRLRTHEGMVQTFTYNRALVACQTVTGFAQACTYYTSFAQPDSVVQAGSPKRTFWLGSQARVDSLSVGPYKTRFTYDSRFRVTQQKDHLNHATTFQYNTIFGSLDITTAPGSRVVKIFRDGFGRDTASQAATEPIRHRKLDLMNRDTLIILDTGPGASLKDSTHIAYAETQHKVTVIDPKGMTYASSGNALGTTTKVVDPAGNSDLYLVDALSRITRWRNRRGDTIKTVYDSLDRRTADTRRLAQRLPASIPGSTTPLARGSRCTTPSPRIRSSRTPPASRRRS